VSVVAAALSEPADPPVVSPTRRGGGSWRPHLLVALVALALAGYVTNGLWQDPAGHVLAKNAGDQAFFEWLLGYGVYLLGHGADPFFTDLMNAPVGVNLAANTSITVFIVLFIGIPQNRAYALERSSTRPSPALPNSTTGTVAPTAVSARNHSSTWAIGPH